jgi:hypothetical protein
LAEQAVVVVEETMVRQELQILVAVVAVVLQILVELQAVQVL